jgi:hypothetical protein
VQANLEALRLLDVLEHEQRPATHEEQEGLAAWSGWGAVPQLFDEQRDEWGQARAQVRELAGEHGYEAARRTTINAHYTDPRIAAAIWQAVTALGFTGERVLEPGCGAGIFLALAPADAQLVGVELDPTTAAIARHRGELARRAGVLGRRVHAHAPAAPDGGRPRHIPRREALMRLQATRRAGTGDGWQRTDGGILLPDWADLPDTSSPATADLPQPSRSGSTCSPAPGRRGCSASCPPRESRVLQPGCRQRVLAVCAPAGDAELSTDGVIGQSAGLRIRNGGPIGVAARWAAAMPFHV